jgi:hypothetical protein
MLRIGVTMASMLKIAVLLVALFLVGGTARADLLPSCAGTFDSLITCAAADVGKACQGGGQCYEISCFNGGGAASGKIYKCDACPTVVPSSDECSIPNLGQPCGDAGTATCNSRPNHCVTSGSRFVCQTPATDKPTGPPGSGAAGTGGGAAGTGGGTSNSGGCDVVPSPPKPTAIGLGLLAIGVVLFFVDRLRRRSR